MSHYIAKPKFCQERRSRRQPYVFPPHYTNRLKTPPDALLRRVFARLFVFANLTII